MKIAQVLGSGVWGDVGPDKLDEGIGGREGALIRLAREWARLGHEVTNFVATGEPKRFHDGEGFHEYVPMSLARPCMASFPYDACVAWECPSIYNHERITGLQLVRLTEMQCAHLPSDEDRIAASTVATGLVTLSEWHRDFMVHDGIRLPPDRLHVLPNCVDLGLYPEQVPGAKFDDPKKFLYSSSPDRGLWHLLRMWPAIRERWPEAELYIAYGFESWVSSIVWAHHRLGEMALEMAGLVSQPGVFDLGKVGQRQLAELQMTCTAWLYPCDTIQPTETGCITAIEAMAAYCPAVITDCDCLGEEFGDVAAMCGMPFSQGSYIAALEKVLGDRELYTDLATAGREFARERQWRLVAPRWIELFKAERSRS